MKSLKNHSVLAGFTLVQTLVVLAILAVLAALFLPSGSIALKNGKRRTNESMLTAVESALELYHDEYGEFPEPSNSDETAEVMPGKVYRIGAARCLYQAMTGEAGDAIQQRTKDESGLRIFKDMPSSFWRDVGGKRILVDAFGAPFQYTKAEAGQNNTVNSTYDLWSFSGDDENIMATSKQTESNPQLGSKWIKNW
ncbi:MAG: hypothetical protein IPK32_01110 [Verrucomicrobiaceae bacterium]|nr:hypothetical protein [Verrucomicrobiaceae bacterium]